MGLQLPSVSVKDAPARALSTWALRTTQIASQHEHYISPAALGLDRFKRSRQTATVANTTLLHQLFPIVRAEVLRLLFTNTGHELYVRELARLAFLSLQTVQDELAKLEAARLISSRSNGYQRFYRSNPKHPLYRTLRKLVIDATSHRKPSVRARGNRNSRGVT